MVIKGLKRITTENTEVTTLHRAVKNLGVDSKSPR